MLKLEERGALASGLHLWLLNNASFPLTSLPPPPLPPPQALFCPNLGGLGWALVKDRSNKKSREGRRRGIITGPKANKLALKDWEGTTSCLVPQFVNFCWRQTHLVDVVYSAAKIQIKLMIKAYKQEIVFEKKSPDCLETWKHLLLPSSRTGSWSEQVLGVQKKMFDFTRASE